MNFFERHDRFFDSSTVGTRLPDGSRSPRLRFRYEAIIERNRAMFCGASVLDLASHDGRWSLAALDAGASFVLGIEGREHLVAAAQQNFDAYHVLSERYRFEQGDVPAAMASLQVGTFNLILCLGIFYHSVRHVEFFEHFRRLQPRHVILDTDIVRGDGAAVHFKYEPYGDASSLRTDLPRAIVGHPTHGFIEMLCDQFGFAWHNIDWRSFRIERWDDMADYRDDLRRTYVLTRG